VGLVTSRVQLVLEMPHGGAVNGLMKFTAPLLPALTTVDVSGALAVSICWPEKTHHRLRDVDLADPARHLHDIDVAQAIHAGKQRLSK